MKLTIGIATRGRRELAQRTALETLRNCDLDTTRLIILADSDDDVAYDLPANVIINVQPRGDSIAEKWNRMPSIAPADVYMPWVDYCHQATPGFDTKILQAATLFHDGIGCVYHDLANMSFPFGQAVTARMAEIMGEIYPTMFPYWFVDHWLDDICRMTGRFVHAHGDTTVMPRPSGTHELREPAFWAVLFDALRPKREEAANRLLAHMDEPEWRKDMLRAQWPLIHQRSMMVNNVVRNIPENDTSRDERYLRIKSNAMEHLRGVSNHWQFQ